MPFAGFKDFNDCVEKMKKKEGYSEEVAKKVCGKLQAETEKNEIKTICVQAHTTSKDFFPNLSQEEREKIASQRCENLIKSIDLPLLIKRFEQNIENSNSIFITAVGITSKYVDFDLLEKSKNNLINTKLIWRHFHPADNSQTIFSPIYGYLRDFEIKEEENEKKLICTFEVFGDFKYQQELQKYIRDNEGIGVSARIMTFRDVSSGKSFVHFEEFSITPIPKCDECIILPNKGDIKMEVTKDELNNVVASLNKQIEEKNATISEFETKNLELETQIRELKAEIDKKESEITFLKEKKPLIDKILEALKVEDEKDRNDIITNFAKLPTKVLEYQLKVLERPKVPEPTITIENNIKNESKSELSDEELLRLMGIEVNSNDSTN